VRCCPLCDTDRLQRVRRARHSTCVNVGAVGGDVIEVIRDPDDPQNETLLTIGNHFMYVHGEAVRPSEPCIGKMKAAGDHDHLGEWRKYACPVQERLPVARGMERAGRIFNRRFRGRSLGWEEMLELQAGLWPLGTPWWPQQWDVSHGLGNAKHRDRDASRCFAGWFARRRGPFRTWFLLFPDIGLAIRLAHGTFVSWNGATQPHCTAVPADGEGDAFVSVFCGLQQKACDVLSREIACEEELVARSARGGVREKGESGIDLFMRLEPRMHVSVLCAKLLEREVAVGKSRRALRRYGQKHRRWGHCIVVGVTRGSDACVTLRDASGGKVWGMSVSDVSNRLVIGWYGG
jgi:hypothetical protein